MQRLILSFLLIAPLAAQQDSSIPSGPPVGTALKPVMVYAPAGDRAGQEYDIAADIGKGPGIILFVHEFTRPTLGLIRNLDRTSQPYRLLGLRTHVTFITADRTKMENQLKRTHGNLGLVHPLTVNLDGAEGPGDYALNRKCLLTLITCKNGKVVESIGMTDVGGLDTRSVIERLVGAMPKNSNELRGRLSDDPVQLKEHIIRLYEMLDAQREPTQPGRTQPVDAGALRAELGAAIAAGKMTREEAGEIYKKRMAGRGEAGREQAKMREGDQAKMREGDQAKMREGDQRKRATRGETESPLKKRLAAAVEAGTMTREEADEFYKKRMAEQGRDETAGRTRRGNRPPAGAKREGKAPQDEELKSLLRGIIQRDNSVEDNVDLFKKVDQKVGDDTGLKKQAVEMFKLLRSLNYGTDDARKRAKTYIDKHGKPVGRR